MNKEVINIHLQVLCGHTFSLLGKDLGFEFLDHMVRVFSTL